MKTGYALVVVIVVVLVSSVLYYRNETLKTNNSITAKENIKKINSNQNYFYRMTISYKNGITDNDAIDAIYSVLEKDLDAKIKTGERIDINDIFYSPNDMDTLKAIASKFGIPIRSVFGVVYDYEVLMKKYNEQTIH